jgi:hypothetical protein
MSKAKSGEHPAVRELHRTIQVARVETGSRCAASERKLDEILRRFLDDPPGRPPFPSHGDAA